MVGEKGPAGMSLRYFTHVLRIRLGIRAFKRVKESSCIS
jgi:hypothetical protein